MRFKILSVTNFGPYKDFSIDFTNLKPLALINGDTGAGKTFIFDALCFALYKKPASSGRASRDNLRKFACEPTDVTSVKLIFEANEAEYTVYRGWSLNKKGKRTNEEQYLVTPNSTITAVEEIDELCEKLIGLSFEHFIKVILVPQGRYLEILQAKTEDRAELFRDLFGEDEESGRLITVLEDKLCSY
jgi:exonuclease SbcC